MVDQTNDERQDAIPPITDGSKKVLYGIVLVAVLAGMAIYFAPYLRQMDLDTQRERDPKWSRRDEPPGIPIDAEKSPAIEEISEPEAPDIGISEEEKQDIWERLRADPFVIDDRNGGAEARQRAEAKQRKESADSWARGDSNRRFYADIAGSGQPERAYARQLTGPECTLLQGTLLSATLITPATSEVPGQLNAVLSFPAYNFVGDTVLMEAGTKLMAETNNNDSRFGLKRIFAVWTRAVTPSGVDVPLLSVGADRLGRSGLPAEVDYHFWERFGYAGLISILGAGVDSIEDSDTLKQIGSDMAGEARDFLSPWTRVPPTRNVSQGSEITIYASRDIDFCG